MKRIFLMIAITLLISLSLFAATIYEAATKEDMLYLLNSVVQDGDTVKLLNDVNIQVGNQRTGDWFSVPKNCLVTLDLNGKLINSNTATSGNWCGVGQNSALIIKNGSIAHIDTNENDTGVLVISNVNVSGTFYLGTTQSWLVNGTAVSDLHRENGSVNPNSNISGWVGAPAPAILGKGTSWKCYSTIQEDFAQANYSGNEQIILLKDLKLTSSATLSAPGRLFDLSGYTITTDNTNKLYANNTSGEVTFRNGKVNGNIYANGTDPSASLRLQDMTVTGTVYSEGETVYIESGYYNSLQKTGNFKISGGKFIEKPSVSFLAKDSCYIEEINEIHDGKTYNWIVYQDFYVASNGNDTTGDGTLANPFQTIGKANSEVRADNVTIKLLTDIEQSSPIDMIGRDIRIDGLGKKLIGPAFSLRIGSKVVIRNIVMDGGSNSYGNTGYITSNRSTLTLDNGTSMQNITGEEDGIIYIDNGSVLTIKPGAKISNLTGNRGLIRLNSNSSLNLMGGEITGNTVKSGGVITSGDNTCKISVYGRPYVNKNFIVNTSTHANIYLSNNQLIDYSQHMIGDSLVSVSTENSNYSSDILVGENALLYDSQHSVADNLSEVGIIYCDGTKDWTADGKEVLNTNHIHSPRTVWLSTSAAHEHIWEYVGGSYKITAYCSQEKTLCDNHGLQNGIVLELKTDNHKRLTPTINPSYASNKNVLWSSSDSNVVKIDKNGNLWAQSLGTAIITAKTADESNKEASVTVTVTENP